MIKEAVKQTLQWVFLLFAVFILGAFCKIIAGIFMCGWNML